MRISDWSSDVCSSDLGMLAMMEFYLDDSGTHEGSRVAVWGGVVGYRQFFSEFKIAWKAQLARPCEGRPPIKAFHSSHLVAGRGEFAGYSEAERDLTRWTFRKAILDAGLTVFSFGLSRSEERRVGMESVRDDIVGRRIIKK